ncbi:hypothetical protein MKZ38_006648 [Zalerion maritima]|uniref:Uncharacterized protein n=1 Tax=Zalerion maritima TaxID=339359 RepID=A0AAD5RXC8_9PEZI|nr:hypothetical protein MKZ38_006648 [Zalerion maritima]
MSHLGSGPPKPNPHTPIALFLKIGIRPLRFSKHVTLSNVLFHPHLPSSSTPSSNKPAFSAFSAFPPAPQKSRLCAQQSLAEPGRLGLDVSGCAGLFCLLRAPGAFELRLWLRLVRGREDAILPAQVRSVT